MKATGIADYSVGTVWHIQGDNCYLRDLIRNRLDFPELKRAVIRFSPKCVAYIKSRGQCTALARIDDQRPATPPLW
jgi:phage terminase large subunit-like protein